MEIKQHVLDYNESIKKSKGKLEIFLKQIKMETQYTKTNRIQQKKLLKGKFITVSTHIKK
jgi:hypothetical protein